MQYLAILSVLVIIAVSVIVTKVATIALAHTGMSREMARFQARSAFTGVGFTTNEAESVVNHPVRRRIVMMLMLLGNAGIVTVISSLIIGFVNTRAEGPAILPRIAILAAGVAALWMLANSPMVDRVLNRAINRALKRWTTIDVADYGELLHLRGDYRVGELRVEKGDWMQGETLEGLGMRDEGVNVLGIERADGSYVGTPRGKTCLEAGDVIIVYGRTEAITRLDERPADWLAEREHEKAVLEHRRRLAREMQEERKRRREGEQPEAQAQA